MTNYGVGFEDQIVAAIVDLGLQNFESPIAAPPEVLHHLARE